MRTGLKLKPGDKGDAARGGVSRAAGERLVPLLQGTGKHLKFVEFSRELLLTVI